MAISSRPTTTCEVRRTSRASARCGLGRAGRAARLLAFVALPVASAPPLPTAAVPFAQATPASLRVPDAAPAPQSDTRETLMSTLQSYLRAVEAEDAQRLAEAWSDTAIDRELALRSIRSTWPALDYEFVDISIAVLAIEGSTAQVRVSATRRERGLTPELRQSRWSRIFDLAFADERWRITAEHTAADVFAERILGAPDDAARADLVSEASAAVGPELAEALMRVSDREHIERRLDRALSGYGVVRGLARSLGDAALEVAALQNLGNIHYVQQTFDRALEMYQGRLAIEEARGNLRGVAIAWQAIASAHYASSRYDLAQGAYERVIELERKVGTRASIATTLANLGNVYYLQGTFESALSAYREALDLQVQLANELERARLEFGIGRTLTALGSYTSAAAIHRLALERRERLDSRAEQGASLQELARVQFLQGELNASLDTYDRAADVEQALQNAAGLGRIALSKGLVYSTLGRYVEALEAYRASVARFEAGGEVASTGYGWLGAASVALETGRPDAALIDYRRSMQVFETHQDLVGVSRALVGTAMAQIEQRSFEPALAAAARAADLAEKAGTLESRWQAEYQRGRALWFLGRRDEAAKAYAMAASLVDEAREEAASRNDEGRTLADRVAPFTALVELHVHRGESTRALLAAEEQKQRLLAELLHEHRWRVTGDLDAAEVQEERNLTGRLITTSQQRRRARSRVPQVPEVVEALDRRLAEDRAALRDFETRMTSRRAWLRGRAREAVSLERARAVLRPGRVVVEFVVGDLETYAIAAKRNESGDLDVGTHTIEISRRDLRTLVEVFEAQLDAGRDEGELAASLFARLFGSLASAVVSADELVIVPDGPLWLLSFAALRAPEQVPLIERASLQMTPALLQAAGSDVEVKLAESGESEATRSRATLVIRGRVLANDASPFHATLSSSAGDELAAAAPTQPLDRVVEGLVELRSVLSIGGLPSAALLERLEVAGETNEGEGLIGVAWAFGVAGVDQLVWRRCQADNCDDRRALEALEHARRGKPLSAAGVRSAVLELRRSEVPTPARVWASIVALGRVP